MVDRFIYLRERSRRMRGLVLFALVFFSISFVSAQSLMSFYGGPVTISESNVHIDINEKNVNLKIDYILTNRESSEHDVKVSFPGLPSYSLLDSEGAAMESSFTLDSSESKRFFVVYNSEASDKSQVLSLDPTILIDELIPERPFEKYSVELNFKDEGAKMYSMKPSFEKIDENTYTFSEDNSYPIPISLSWSYSENKVLLERSVEFSQDGSGILTVYSKVTNEGGNIISGLDLEDGFLKAYYSPVEPEQFTEVDSQFEAYYLWKQEDISLEPGQSLSFSYSLKTLSEGRLRLFPLIAAVDGEIIGRVSEETIVYSPVVSSNASVEDISETLSAIEDIPESRDAPLMATGAVVGAKSPKSIIWVIVAVIILAILIVAWILVKKTSLFRKDTTDLKSPFSSTNSGGLK